MKKVELAPIPGGENLSPFKNIVKHSDTRTTAQLGSVNKNDLDQLLDEELAAVDAKKDEKGPSINRDAEIDKLLRDIEEEDPYDKLGSKSRTKSKMETGSRELSLEVPLREASNQFAAEAVL